MAIIPATNDDRKKHREFLKALKEGRVKRVTIDENEFLEAAQSSIQYFLDTTGIREVDASLSASIECDVEFHFRQMSGPGADLAYYLYTISCRIAYKSKTFSISLADLRPYLSTKSDHLVYDAADLLVRTAWWIKLEAEEGQPTKYRPRNHDEWAALFEDGKYCIRKQDAFPFKDDDDISKLGQRLWAVFGQLKLYPSWIKSLQKTGLADDQIVEAAKQFILIDANNGSYLRFKRFHEYLVKATGGAR